MTVLGIPAKLARAALVILVTLDLVALAAFSLHRTTTTRTTIRPLSQGAAAPSTASTQRVATTPTIPVPTDGGSVTIPVSEPTGGISSQPSSGRHPGKGTTPATPPTSTPPKTGIPPITEAEIGTCPVKLDKPAQMGGVQSLVPFAPAFGPFSAEAFASAAAYQPELELLGPILAEYPTFAPKVAPLLNPVLKLFATGSNSLFNVISPIYSPHRTAVLAAETKLATFFAPYSKKLAGQPLAGCVVDLEAALVGDTKPGAATPTVARRATNGARLLGALKLG